jgi:hypothetical protein
MPPAVRRGLTAALVSIGCLSLLPRPLRADVGPPDPSPRRTFTFHVTHEGLPLAGRPCQFVLLSPNALSGPRRDEKAGENPHGDVPNWLPPRALYDPDGTAWRVSLNGRHELDGDGTVTFAEKRGGGYREDLSGRFRLAAYLPDEDRVLLSPVTDVRSPSRNLYHADLGESEIELRPLSPYSVAYWKAYLPPVLIAAGATLLLQLCVVLTWVAILCRAPKPYGRVALVCLLANLILSPLLLGVSLGLRVELVSYEASLAIFFGLLALGVLAQTVVYARAGKLSARGATGLAVSANLASLGFGCCLVSFPGWYL